MTRTPQWDATGRRVNGWQPLETMPNGQLWCWCVYMAGAEARICEVRGGVAKAWGVTQTVTHWQRIEKPGSPHEVMVGSDAAAAERVRRDG